MEREIQELAQHILDTGDFFSLGTIDDGGLWVSDVHYVADEHWNIYWLSARSVRHSKAIEQQPEVAGAIRITATSEDQSEALQIAGHVQIVEEDAFKEIEKIFLQKRGKEKTADTERYHGALAWYKLTPTKIRLTHQETFGLEKKDVRIPTPSR